MTKFEKERAAIMLRLAADEFSNHGCNDYELPNTDEGWAFYTAMEDRNRTPEADRRKRPAASEKTFYVGDWEVMCYLAAKLESETETE